MRVYLDHNATTPLAPPVRERMAASLSSVWGNPSSLHREGRRARDEVEAARRAVAALIGARPDELVFTSGGTEADVMGILGLADCARRRSGGAPVLAPAIEHPAVGGAVARLAAEGMPVVAPALDAAGTLEPAALGDQPIGLLCVALANHELGTVQDVAALAETARARGGLVFCDAVQAAGKLSIDVGALGVDALAISAHKIGGPKGVGALWLRSGVEVALPPASGHQERGRRPGTENLLGIIGFGAAAELARSEWLAQQPRIAALRDRLEVGLLALPGVEVLARQALRVANTTCAVFAGARGESIVAALDLAGVSVSTGAACTSGTVRASPVLRAVGLSEGRAVEAVRFSLGVGNGESEIDAVLALLPPLLERARRWS